MKKIILGFMLLFIPIFAVNASTSVDGKNLIEKIELTSKSAVTYNGQLEVTYKITPSNANNKKLTWSVSGLKEGITATFVNGNVTNDSEGTIKIEFKNETDESVAIKVVAYNYANNITKKLDVSVKTKEITLEKLEELKALINSLPEEVGANNYKDVEKILSDIDTLIYENDGLEDLLNNDLLDKYNYVLEAFNNYDKRNINTGTIVTIVVLVMSFILGIFIIFKKEK